MEGKGRTRETRQRRVVLATLRATKTHPTAEWVFDQVRRKIPQISLGTVYRNLNVLRSEGKVREIKSLGRSTRWDADTSAHGHFACTDCGALRDVKDVPEYEWQGLKDLVGCEVMEQRVEFFGLCPACLRKHRRKH